MKRFGLPLAAIVATLGLTLTACSSGPPSQDDIAESLVDNASLPEGQADCVAEKVLDSDLSDDQLNAIADDDESDLDGGEITEVGEVLGQAIIDCPAE